MRRAPLPASWTRRAAARAAAREAGARAARYGLSRDVNPWGEGTELSRSWNAGWRDYNSKCEGCEDDGRETGHYVR